MGLVIVAALALYLLVSIAVVFGAIRHAKKTGKSVKRWGWGAVLVMYLIPFWDWIPTVAVHQYYCATEAGFWVYKSVDQWKAENPGVMKTLVANKGAPSSRQGNMTNHTDTYFLNQRINWVIKRFNDPLFNQWRHEQEVVDNKTNDVLAHYVDFSTAQTRAGGGWYGWKFWLHNEHCGDGERNQSLIRRFKNNLRGADK